MPRLHLDLSQVSTLPLTHEAVIAADYLDEMGHMNVMWYTHLFSEGMGGLFALAGFDWTAMDQHGGGTFALETHIRYLAEVRATEHIATRSRMLGRSEKRFHAIHFMTRDQDLAATFEVVGAYVDMRTRRMAPIPESIANEFDQLIAAHDALGWDAPVCGVMRP